MKAQYSDILNSLSRITNRSIYIYDILKNSFHYISPNPLFLCGFSVKDAFMSGSDFFRKIVHTDDLAMLHEIWFAAQEKFSQFEELQKFKVSLSYSYRLKHLTSIITVDQSLTPLFVDDRCEMRMVICLVSISSQERPGNVIMDCGDKSWEYSLKMKKWIKKESVSFSGREKEIILLSAQGKSNKEIAKHLFIDISTVKSHKYNLFQKLQANNICKAIGFLNKGNFFR